MKYKFQVDFEDIKKGAEFEQNGTLWVKQSTRTARVVKPIEYVNRWFYFGSREKINISDVA